MILKKCLIILNLLLIVAILFTTYKAVYLHFKTKHILKDLDESLLAISQRKSPSFISYNRIDQEEDTNQSEFMKIVANKPIFGMPPKPTLQAVLGPSALIDGQWHILNEKQPKTNLILLRLDPTSATIQDGHSTMTLEMFQYTPTPKKIVSKKNKEDKNNKYKFK